MNTRLLLVGCGKMGSAMLEGWLAQGLKADNVYIVEQPEAAEKLATSYGINGITDVADVPQDFIPQVVLFAVKPQVLPDVIDAYKPLVRAETVFLSVAAGKTIEFFARHLGEPCPHRTRHAQYPGGGFARHDRDVPDRKCQHRPA